MRRHLLLALSLIASLVLTAGCGGGNKYRVMQNKMQHQPIPVRAIVTDFTDERGFKVEASSGLIMVPLVPFSPYRYERYDELFKGSVDPFRNSLAKNFSERLAEVGVFDSVTYAPEGAKPERGQYDVEVRTRMIKLDGKGAKTRYGLSFLGDILWYLGVPYYSRRWDMDMEMQLVNGYTGEPIGEPIRSSAKTGRRLYTIYGNLSTFKDLYSKSEVLWDGFIDSAWKKLEAPDSRLWADIPAEGAKILAAEARENQQIRQGSPPVFSMQSPTDNASVRGEKTTIRWSATAPGRLKQAVMTVNNQPVELGLKAIELADPDSAPLAVPATEMTINLNLGPNKIETLLIDHRGNKTTGSFTINRIPGELFPTTRRALLIGGDADWAITSVERLSGVLANPMLGQFPASSVTTISNASLTQDALLSGVAKFGATLKSGELALIYIAGKGDGSALTLAGGLSVDDLVRSVRSSLPTDEVIFMLDIDWSGDGGSDSISDRVDGIPARWAFVTSSDKAAATTTKGGMSAFADAIIGTMEGRTNKEVRVSLERLLDETVTATQSASGKMPGVSGRYNSSITMVQRD